MKTPIHSSGARWCARFILPTLIASVSLPSQVSAATTWYWDTVINNGQIDAGSGSWNSDSSNLTWSGTSTGATNTSWTSGSTNIAVFGGSSAAVGSYIISVDPTGVQLQNITFSSTGYLLTAATTGTIAMGASSSGTISLGAGITASIGNGVTVISGSSAGSQPLNITGSGTLILGTNSASAPAIIKTGLNNNINITGGATLLVNTNGYLQPGVLTSNTTAGAIVVGNNSGNASLVVNGGLVSNFSNLVLGNAAATGISTFTLESGTAATWLTNGIVRFGPNSGGSTSGTSIVNLNGGLLNIGGFAVGSSGSALYYVNFNGSVVKATQSTTSFMNSSSQLTAKVLAGAVFDTNGYNITIAQALVTGSTSGNDGGLTKQGAGTLTLTGANTYTGATTVKSGSLVVGASGNISSTVVLGGSGGLSGTVDVSLKGSSYSLANLSGQGAMLGAVGSTITATGAVSPGVNVGELDVSTNFTLAGTAATSMEISGNGGIAGTDSDYLKVSGILTYGGSLVISSYNSYDLSQAGTYTLFNFTSSSGDFSSVTVDGVSLTKLGEVWSNSSSGYSFDESTGVLSVTAIPEPSTYAILVSGLGMLGLLRRKSRA